MEDEPILGTRKIGESNRWMKNQCYIFKWHKQVELLYLGTKGILSRAPLIMYFRNQMR